MMIKWYPFVLMLALLCGCGETPNPCHFADVQKGMTPSEVRAVLGEPDWVFVGRSIFDVKVIQWDFNCDGAEFTVRFDDGIVISVTSNRRARL